MPNEINLRGCKDNQTKKEISYLDALDASFAVVAFDVYVNFSVAHKAEIETDQCVG